MLLKLFIFLNLNSFYWYIKLSSVILNSKKNGKKPHNIFSDLKCFSINNNSLVLSLREFKMSKGS